MPVTIFAVGDTAGAPSKNPGSERTALALVEHLGNTPDAKVLLLGDLAYDDGTEEEFETWFRPIWGVQEIFTRTLPCPGNHDYNTDGARAYASFFKDKAAPQGVLYYAQVLGDWLLISLNSEIPCESGSPQVLWLRNLLAQSQDRPILAFFHRPRFGSGGHGDSETVRQLWKELSAHHSELVISGHAHHYERFARQDYKGNADSRGIREFIVGSGGRKHHPKTKKTRNSEIDNFATGCFGFLKLQLSPDSYTWEFIDTSGSGFVDHGQSSTNRSRFFMATALNVNPRLSAQAALAMRVLSAQIHTLSVLGDNGAVQRILELAPAVRAVAEASGAITLDANSKVALERTTFILEGLRDGFRNADLDDEAERLADAITGLQELVAAYNANAK